MKTFTSDEIWNTVVPGDFKGDKTTYLIYLRQEKKEAAEKASKKRGDKS